MKKCCGKNCINPDKESFRKEYISNRTFSDKIIDLNENKYPPFVIYLCRYCLIDEQDNCSICGINMLDDWIKYDNKSFCRRCIDRYYNNELKLQRKIKEAKRSRRYEKYSRELEKEEIKDNNVNKLKSFFPSLVEEEILDLVSEIKYKIDEENVYKFLKSLV